MESTDLNCVHLFPFIIKEFSFKQCSQHDHQNTTIDTLLMFKDIVTIFFLIYIMYISLCYYVSNEYYKQKHIIQASFKHCTQNFLSLQYTLLRWPNTINSKAFTCSMARSNNLSNRNQTIKKFFIQGYVVPDTLSSRGKGKYIKSYQMDVYRNSISYVLFTLQKAFVKMCDKTR